MYDLFDNASVRYKYQSKRKSIGLLGVGKTKTRKEMGYDRNDIVQYNQRVQMVRRGLDKVFLNTFYINVSDGHAKLHGTGMQKYEFFVLFALIDYKVTRSSLNYQVYYLLRAIVDFCLSPKIRRDDLAFYECLVKKFLTIFKQAFPTKPSLTNSITCNTIQSLFWSLVFWSFVAHCDMNVCTKKS